MFTMTSKEWVAIEYWLFWMRFLGLVCLCFLNTRQQCAGGIFRFLLRPNPYRKFMRPTDNLRQKRCWRNLVHVSALFQQIRKQPRILRRTYITSPVLPILKQSMKARQVAEKMNSAYLFCRHIKLDLKWI